MIVEADHYFLLFRESLLEKIKLLSASPFPADFKIILTIDELSSVHGIVDDDFRTFLYWLLMDETNRVFIEKSLRLRIEGCFEKIRVMQLFMKIIVTHSLTNLLL